MAYNKIVFDGKTLIDLTDDTVTADKLANGATAHDASGGLITGTMISGTGNTLHVTFAEELAGKEYTITNGDETITGTVPDDCVLDVTVTGSGEYTVECEGTTATVTVTNVYDVELKVEVVTDLPYQDGTLYYTGGELTPTWANYNPDIMTISGETSATKVGTYIAVFTLANGYAWPNGTNTLEVTWKIDSAVVTDLPYQTGELYYDGTELTPEWANYNADIMTIGGVTSAIEAGTYTATFTLADGYVWPDGGNTLDVEWTIEEASGEIPSGDIYVAFYSADDSSLNFCGLAMVPETGQIALGKTITTVYTDVTNTGTSTSSIPWYSDRTNFTTVIFDSSFAGAKPAQTAYWFYNFTNCTAITGLSYLNTSNVTNMTNMFYSCSGLTALDVSNFNTSNVTNMSYMFYSCSGLTSLSVSNFDTSNVTYMSYMFQSCSGLTALDVSNFDTSKVTNMTWMFARCSGLTSLDVSNFNTSNVTNMSYMFQACEPSTLDLSKFDTSNVTTMSSMFQACELSTLDVSNFNTAKVTDMSYMFQNCSKLTTIYSNDSKFVTTKVTSGDNMFTSCSKLVGGNGTKYSSSNVTYTMAHVDTADNPGYFTAK